MHYNTINFTHITSFQNIVGKEHVHTKEEVLLNNASDHTENFLYKPHLVIEPSSTQEIADIMKYCFDENIVVTVRGAGTGLSGGALPIYGGLVINTKRLNKIWDIDIENFQATIDPGVINFELQEEVKKHGLFYPPDPASWGSCFMGGNVAHASGGPRAVKYGTTRDYILNLEIVLPNGEIIWTGANTLKYSTGYNLTHLFIGSEGTLGIVTKIVVKLISYNPLNQLLLVAFDNIEESCKAVNSIFLAGVLPSACEFIEREALDFVTQAFTDIKLSIEPNVKAHLLIEIDGTDLDIISKEIEKVFLVLEKYKPINILVAESEEQKNTLWKARRKIGEAVKQHSIYKEEDTVVPRATLPILLTKVKQIGKKYGFKSICYGHAGDGNLHINILKEELSANFWEMEIPKAIVEIFEVCKTLNGTISGEHGIGLVQKKYMPIMFSPTHFQLFKGIKQTFDPKNILNPGKIFDL